MRTISRALSVFDCFSSASPALTLLEISRRVGLAKSTTFRLVKTLEESGYLVRLEDQKYCLSLRFARLGGLAQATLGVCQIARPAMKEVARISRESVTLFTVEDGEYVCLAVCTLSNPLMIVHRPGERAPLGLGAASLVLLAYLPEASQRGLLPSVARRVRHSRRELTSILGNVRKQRYAVSHGGSIPGISAISVPLFGLDDTARYSLNIVMPTVRARGRVAPMLKLLRGAAARVSAGLGATTRKL